jgi:hypothetical protein
VVLEKQGKAGDGTEVAVEMIKVAFTFAVLVATIFSQPAEFRQNARFYRSVAIDSTPASSNPVSVIVKDSGSNVLRQLPIDSLQGSDSVRAAHKADIADSATRVPASGGPHGVTLNHLSYSLGGTSWGTLPIRFNPYLSNFSADSLVYTDNSQTYSGIVAAYGDSTSYKIGSANGATLTLYGRNSCCKGVFNLTAGPATGYTTFSYIVSSSLNVYTDTNLVLKQRNLEVCSAEGFPMLVFDGVAATGTATFNRNVRIYNPTTTTVSTGVYVPKDDTVALESLANFKLSLGTMSTADTATWAKQSRRFRVGVAPDTTVFDSTGRHMYGNARQWNDVGSFKLSTYKSAGTPETPVDGAPSYSPKGNGFSGMQFLVNDSASGEEEILHGFVENDSSDLHMHYETGSMDNTTRYLRFEAFIGYKKPGDSLFTVSHRDTLEDTIPANTGKLWYRVRSFGLHATPGITIGSMYCLKVRRITATGTAPSAGPFIMNINIHRRIDSDGSRGVYTK